jgi:phage terminase small subunit
MGALSKADKAATAAAHAAGELTDIEAACTPNERKFVYWLMQLPPKTGFQVQAARLAGYGKKSTPLNVNGIVQDLLKKQRVIDLIAEVTKKTIRSAAPHAIAAVQEILADPKHKDRLKAANVVLERIDPTVVRHDINVTHTIDRNAEAVAYLRKLKALGVSRDKLEDELGYSDLPRYERLLALEDASRGAPVIDADYAVVDVTQSAKTAEHDEATDE